MGLLSWMSRGRASAPEAAMAPANVAPAWADRATFSAWEAPCSWVRAEPRYQPALRALAGPPRDGGHLVPVEVTFVREPGNPRHPNALYAEVRGRLVGYLVPEIAEVIAPSLDRRGAERYTCCGVIRGRSSTATSLGVEVWLARRPCAGLELAVDERLEGAPVSWPPRETEGVPRVRERESRTARRRAQRRAGAGYSFQPGRTSPDW